MHGIYRRFVWSKVRSTAKERKKERKKGGTGTRSTRKEGELYAAFG